MKYHHGLLLQSLSIYKRRGLKNYDLSHRTAMEKTGCKNIKTTMTKRRLRLTGNLLHMWNERLSKGMPSEELDGRTNGRGQPVRQWPQSICR